jgi:hypothetical protein
MADHPHLTLVDPSKSKEHDEEFIPLPFYPWDSRPPSLPLDPDECATAIHIAQGDLPAAANLLKVPLHKLNRQIRNHPRLARVLQETNELTVARAASEYITALSSPSERRREWASTKIMASRAAQSHPFSPAPAQPGAASLSLSDTPAGRTLTFRWRTDADETVTIDHEPDSGTQ